MRSRLFFPVLITVFLVSCSQKNGELLMPFREALEQNRREDAEGLFVSLQDREDVRRDLFYNYALFLINQEKPGTEGSAESDSAEDVSAAEDRLKAEHILERLLQLHPEHKEAARSLEYLRRLRFEENLQEELKQDLEDMKQQQDQAESQEDQEQVSEKAGDWQDKASESRSEETREASEKMSEIQKKMDEASEMKQEGRQKDFEEKQDEIQKDLQKMSESLANEEESSGAEQTSAAPEEDDKGNNERTEPDKEMEDILSQEQDNPESNQNNKTENDTVNYRNW